MKTSPYLFSILLFLFSEPGKVENLKGEYKGRNVELSWAEVPLEQQNGFIKGYKVTLLSGSETFIRTILTEGKFIL